MFIIVIDDTRNMIQLLQVGAIFLVQLSVFIVMMRKVYMRKYFRWFTNLKQSINPLFGLSILVIPVAMYFIYQSVFSGQFNGFSAKGLMMNSVFFLLGAVSEEMVFRGFLYKYMIKKNKKFAIFLIIFQALLFTFTHLNNPGGNWIRFLNIFLAGFLLGLIAIRGFLYAVLFHFLWNFMQAYMLGLNVSGYSFTESLNTLLDAPAWENNIHAAILLGTGIAVLLPFLVRKKKLFL